MILHYGVQDAKQWAAFSGDYNPIHFDLMHAKKIGATQLTVHGMRAMLDVKRGLSEHLSQLCAPWCVFSARMRKPLLCEQDYHVAFSTAKEKVAAKVLSAERDELCVSAKLTGVNAEVVINPHSQETLSLAQISALSELFPGEPFAIKQLWGFLDALLFRQLLNAPATLAMVQSVLPMIQGNNLMDAFLQLPVVQTHHETHFDACLLSANNLLTTMECLHYAIQPALVTGCHEQGWVLRIEIQAWWQKPLMSTAITLKTWPSSSI